jgi:tRNA(fMet)-specific endonuclease VapC
LNPGTSLVLLDTNILVHLVRASIVGRRVDEDLSLTTRSERPLISVITVGELFALSRKLNWAAPKRAKLDQLVRQLVIVQLHQGEIIPRYADIDHFCEREMKPARPMGQNDMWIAATASAFDATLVTSDSDFDHLSPRFIKRIRVDAHTGAIVAT